MTSDQEKLKEETRKRTRITMYGWVLVIVAILLGRFLPQEEDWALFLVVGLALIGITVFLGGAILKLIRGDIRRQWYGDKTN